jgi:predicted extracellular nuclease
VFYNLENLFDTIDSPNSNDSEFLPSSKKKWNSYRYNYKLSQLEKVFTSLIKEENNNNLPDIIGLCEVENRQVIKDLLNTNTFADKNYTIIHQESPDSRGIDCALLLSDNIELLKYDFINIRIPDATRATRDIVYAKLEFQNRLVNIFVNHWPSRWGGQVETNFKRVFVAKVLREYIDTNTLSEDYTFILGDFNDYPHNESMYRYLVKDDFINLMSSDLVSGQGSYNYRGNWNWLDQIIVSKNLTQSEVKLLSFGAFQKDFMIYKNRDGEIYPSRTFGGNTWHGGFSDHLPVYLRLVLSM